MKTQIQAMPVTHEVRGRGYFPGHAWPQMVVALVILVGLVAYALAYPQTQTQAALRQLAQYDALTSAADQGTHAALDRMQTLVQGQPQWLQDSAAKQAAELAAQLRRLVQPTPAQITQQAQTQKKSYDNAQQVLRSSPFAGLRAEAVPLSPAGKTYLLALQKTAPKRFVYQQLADAQDSALRLYKEALALQVEAENAAHYLDVRINGKDAGPLAETATSAATGERLRKTVAAEMPAAAAERSFSDPVAEAEQKAKADETRRQRELQQAQMRAEQVARQKEMAARQAQLDAAQRQQDNERKVRAAETARVQAQNDARRQAAAAVEAKKQECTASFFARARCATQGYNPITGEKN